MRKVIMAVATALLGSAILAGGSALADDDDDRRYNRYKKRAVLATGYTACFPDNQAVFPATNVSKRPVWVKVSCVDSGLVEVGESFKGKIPAGEAFTVSVPCNDVGDLVRCTIAGRKWAVERMRGVLHICSDTACSLTEALKFSFDHDD